MKNFLFTCCFFIGQHPLLAQSKIEKIILLEKQRFAAMVNKDTVFLKSILAEDLIYSHSSGEVDSRQSLIKSIAEKKLDYQKMELTDIAHRFYKKFAILNGTMSISLISNGKPLDLKIKYLDVYRKNGKKWQLVAWQSARLN